MSSVSQPLNSATLANVNTPFYGSQAAPVAGVTQIVAGSNVTVSPVGGTGVVTVNAVIPPPPAAGISAVNGTANQIAATTAAGVVSLALAAPSPAPAAGSYALANTTVDALGRVTAATSGAVLGNGVPVGANPLYFATIQQYQVPIYVGGGVYNNASLVIPGGTGSTGILSAASNIFGPPANINVPVIAAGPGFTGPYCAGQITLQWSCDSWSSSGSVAGDFNFGMIVYGNSGPQQQSIISTITNNALFKLPAATQSTPYISQQLTLPFSYRTNTPTNVLNDLSVAMSGLAPSYPTGSSLTIVNFVLRMVVQVNGVRLN
jgi:hypothetical protein